VRNLSSQPGHAPAYRIVNDLNREWGDIVASRSGDVPYEGDRHGLPTTGPALDEVLGLASTGNDAVLAALLARAHEGNRLAARTVLQAMLGRLVRMASRDRSSPVDDYVGALWCVIAAYPLANRPARIAANLALDTLKTVQRDRRWSRQGTASVDLPGPVLDLLLEQSRQRATLDHAGELRQVSAAAVIDAGTRLRLIDEATSRLLQHVYVEGLSGREAAARGGTTAGSLRVRCSRAVRQLAAHAPVLAEAA